MTLNRFNTLRAVVSLPLGLEVTAETCLPDYFDTVGAWWVEQDPRPAPQVPIASE